MKTPLGSSFLNIAATFLLSGACLAQLRPAPTMTQEAPVTQAATSVRGHVVSSRPAAGSGLIVELIDEKHNRPALRVPVLPDGQFKLAEVPVGRYQLSVVDAHDYVLQSQTVDIAGLDGSLEIRLPEEGIERPASGTVSAKQLAHSVPSKARKEFQKAQEASANGDIGKSIEHLEKAIEFDPAYAEAYNNLGARYFQLNKASLAAGQFQKAIDADKTCASAFANLSIALLSLGRLREAEDAARQAVRLSSASPISRKVLGLVHAAGETSDEEALENLTSVEKEFQEVRLTIAKILIRTGRPQPAADELRRYLASGAAANREEVETWITRLEQASSGR